VNRNQFQCCGYFNAQDLIVIGGNFCQNQTFANALDTTVLSNFCVTPITSFADNSLNYAFSYVSLFFLSLETMTGPSAISGQPTVSWPASLACSSRHYASSKSCVHPSICL
jgi:hypothetical protein